MFGEISYGVAFVAGILSFLSPCILPLIPAYLMYIAGVSIESEAKAKRNIMITRTLSFVLGFTIVFLVMGASASLIGKLFVRYRDVFSKVSGLVIVLFGLNLIGILNLTILTKTKKAKSPKNVTSLLGSLLMGVAFAAGWTPCFGPVLASILFYAGSSSNLIKGVLLLGVYSLGMAVPFVLTAMFFSKATSLLTKTEKYAHIFTKAAGVILIVFGLLVFFDKIISISRLFV